MWRVAYGMRDGFISSPASRPSASGSRRETARKRWQRIVSWAAAVLCVGYALGAIGVWVVLRLSGERWWPATLLLFSPRWIYIVPFPFVLAAALVFWRRWSWIPVLTAFFLLFNLMGFNLPWRAALSGSGQHQ